MSWHYCDILKYTALTSCTMTDMLEHVCMYVTNYFYVNHKPVNKTILWYIIISANYNSYTEPICKNCSLIAFIIDDCSFKLVYHLPCNVDSYLNLPCDSGHYGHLTHSEHSSFHSVLLKFPVHIWHSYYRCGVRIRNCCHYAKDDHTLCCVLFCRS